jgi:hypothetical protein
MTFSSITVTPELAESAPRCRRCGTFSWVVPGYQTKTLRPASWLCRRCLVRIKVRVEQTKSRKKAA